MTDAQEFWENCRGSSPLQKGLWQAKSQFECTVTLLSRSKVRLHPEIQGAQGPWQGDIWSASCQDHHLAPSPSWEPRAGDQPLSLRSSQSRKGRDQEGVLRVRSWGQCFLTTWPVLGALSGAFQLSSHLFCTTSLRDSITIPIS